MERPAIIVHPGWELMTVLWWNLFLTSMTPPQLHPYIDEFQRALLRGLHADV
jgi:hypothetical protein